jgi:hypothetical protein
MIVTLARQPQGNIKVDHWNKNDGADESGKSDKK